MRVFDEMERTDFSYKTRLERAYPFLNRAARPEFEVVRCRIEAWFSKYPAAGQVELRERLRSTRDATHLGAMFELMVHELLIALGWVTHTHPVVSGSNSRPDFLATKGVTSIIVEATECRPASSISAIRPHEDAILDAIELIRSPDFFLGVSTHGSLGRAIPASVVVQHLTRFIKSHDYDEVRCAAETHGPESLPTTRFERDGWVLEATLMPKNKLRGDSTTRAIGYGPMRGGWQDHKTPLRRVIRSKASRYGFLEMPLLLAVNASEVDDIDEVEALFGSEKFFWHPSQPDSTTFARDTDGVWDVSGSKPRHTRLSGVLLFRGIAPWSIGATDFCLYLNPFAARPLPADFRRLPHAEVVGERLERRSGSSLGELFGYGPIHR